MTITKKITNITTLIAAIRAEIKGRTDGRFVEEGPFPLGVSLLDGFTTSELKVKIKQLTRRKTMLKTIPPAMRGVIHY
jgi:hypothetical protein|tara:strand:- start:2862 stop:3095 length:234 start_codon:yes stop_codon:yes gene_type:complete